MVTAPVRGRALGDIFMLAPDGVEGKTRAKRTFCLDQELSQVPTTLEAHRNFLRKCNFPMRFFAFSRFFSAGSSKFKVSASFFCKIVLWPQRGRIFHCQHLGFCKGSFCTQCHLQGLAAKTFGFKFVLSPQRGRVFRCKHLLCWEASCGFSWSGIFIELFLKSTFPVKPSTLNPLPT